eukprot:1459_1
MSWQQTMDSMFGYHYGNNSPHPHTPHGTHERVQRLKRPPSLPRIQLHDDIGIVPDHEKKAKKNNSYAQTPNPTSSARKRMKRSKSSKRIETNPKILELEAKIGSLTRDNRVLQRKLETVESCTCTDQKQKKMDNEREMRLAAHKERYSLQQKLEKQSVKKEEKGKEVTFKRTINALHEEIAQKDKMVKSQKKKIEAMQKELDVAGFGDNKTSSQMSLLKSMHNVIMDKDKQIQTLKNKLNTQMK